MQSPDDSAKAEADEILSQLGTYEDLGIPEGTQSHSEEEGTQAAIVLALARDTYTFVRSADVRCYALPKSQAPGGIAIPFGRRLEGKLLQLYHGAKEAIPQIGAVRSVTALLEAELADAEPVPVHIRAAWHDGQVILDLGWRTPHCIVAGPGGWQLADMPPVIFRRSGTCLPMPEPVRGNRAEARILRDLLNCDEITYRLLAGWVIAAWIERIPHPVLSLSGEQGSAKSMCAQILCQIVSPDSTPIRAAVKDPVEWAVCAYASYAFVLDNVSSIEQWLADALCKASTGDGLLKRTLYSNDEVTSLKFRRVVVLTSLDLGGAPGDLTERLLPAELDRIRPENRRTEYSVIGQEGQPGVLDAFHSGHPAIFGMMLDLLCDVLARLPEVSADNLPRMADFAVVLRALDAATGWQTADDYDRLTGNATAALVENSPFAVEIRKMMDGMPKWEGTSTELLDGLQGQVIASSHTLPRGWPGSPAAAGKILTKLAPSLRRVGIEVAKDHERDGRRVRIEKVGVTLSHCHADPEKAILPAKGPVTGAKSLLSRVTGAAVTTVTATAMRDGSVTANPDAAVTPVSTGQAPHFQDRDSSDRRSPTKAMQDRAPSLSVADDSGPLPRPAPVPVIAGSCADCGASCTRYGPGGSPLCASCATILGGFPGSEEIARLAADNGAAPAPAEPSLVFLGRGSDARRFLPFDVPTSPG